MDPQQELFTVLLLKLKEKYQDTGIGVYDTFLPPDKTPYPFVYLADSTQDDQANKTTVFGACLLYTSKRGKLTDVWIEEATEITQSDFEIIDDRLRGELPEGQFYQIRMTFNPVSVHHWIKKVFFDRADSDVLTHQSTYEKNRFIDEAYHRRMLRRKEVDPEGYRVYGLGAVSYTHLFFE